MFPPSSCGQLKIAQRERFVKASTPRRHPEPVIGKTKRVKDLITGLEILRSAALPQNDAEERTFYIQSRQAGGLRYNNFSIIKSFNLLIPLCSPKPKIFRLR
jgi:hypothetical protein